MNSMLTRQRAKDPTWNLRSAAKRKRVKFQSDFVPRRTKAKPAHTNIQTGKNTVKPVEESPPQQAPIESDQMDAEPSERQEAEEKPDEAMEVETDVEYAHVILQNVDIQTPKKENRLQAIVTSSSNKAIKTNPVDDIVKPDDAKITVDDWYELGDRVARWLAENEGFYYKGLQNGSEQERALIFSNKEIGTTLPSADEAFREAAKDWVNRGPEETVNEIKDKMDYEEVEENVRYDEEPGRVASEEVQRADDPVIARDEDETIYSAININDYAKPLPLGNAFTNDNEVLTMEDHDFSYDSVKQPVYLLRDHMEPFSLGSQRNFGRRAFFDFFEGKTKKFGDAFEEKPMIHGRAVNSQYNDFLIKNKPNRQMYTQKVKTGDNEQLQQAMYEMAKQPNEFNRARGRSDLQGKEQFFGARPHSVFDGFFR